MISWQKVSFVSIPALAMLLAGCAMTPKAKHDRALARAKQFIQKKDYPRVVLECRTAIQTGPKDPEAYYELALGYAGEHALQNAVVSLQKALSLNPHFEKAQVALAEVMASSADPEIVKQAQSRMTEVVKADASNAEALDTLALTQLKLGNTGDAVNALNRALEIAPRSLRTSILLAEAKMSQKDIKGAEDVLTRACRRDAHSAEARVLLGQFYLGQKRPGEAETVLLDAVKVNPNSAVALLSLGQLQIKLGKKQQAEETLRRLSVLPDHTMAAAYGLLLFQEGRRDEAVREFERLARANTRDRDARTHLIAAYWSTGRKQEAERVLNDVLAKNPNDADALIQRAEMRIAADNYSAAQADLNTLLHLNSNSAEAHSLLAAMYAGMGDPLRQRQELGEALRLKPVLLGIRLELADLLIHSNGAQSALKVLDETPEFQKKSLAVLVKRNWALMASGDMALARKSIDAGLGVAQVPELVLQDGVWKLQQGDTAGGRAVLERILNTNPDDVRALEILYASYSLRNQAALGAQKLRHYAAQASHSAAVQNFVGKALAANGDYEGARKAFESALVANAALESARLNLIELDIKQGKLDAAFQATTALVASNAKDVEARLLLADMQVMKGDKAAALANYQQVATANPKNGQALNNLAYLLADYKKQPDAALPYAQKAQELAPDNPDYNDTVGLVFYEKGLYGLAAKNFEAAVASPHAAPICSYHLAMAYAKSGQHDRARVAYTTAFRRDPNSAEAATVSQLLAQ